MIQIFHDAKTAIKRLWNSESGATAVEYGIIATAMFLALIPGFLYVASGMGHKFSTLTSFFNMF